MKKVIVLFLAIVMCISFVACGGNGADSNSDNQEVDSDSSAAIQVDEGIINVDVTLGASFFDGMTEEEIESAANENGYSNCKVNEDGSVTYTMTKAKRNEMLDEFKASIEETITGYLDGENEVASFIDIEYNEDFSQVDILVDATAYTMWDSLYALPFYMTGAYYQSFAGVPADEIDVVVNFIDNETKEVLDTASYQEYISNNSERSDASTSADAGQVLDTSDSTAITIQETIEIPDACEFFVDYTNITDDVMPPSPSSWYSHYEADDGKVYVDVCVAYKNLSTKDVGADEILNATLVYGGKYQYTGFSMIEESSRSDFTYSNITSISPLSLEYLHYLFEVPEEIETSDGALTALLNIEGVQYSIVVREGTEGEVSTLNENAVAKTSGTIKDGEVIAIANNCEFYVDYSDITDDVMPPQPEDWYSHYEADDGKVYVDFCVAYKNWKSQNVGADDVISAKLSYAGKYEYTGFSMIEESSRGDFTYSNITSIAPLATEYLHFLFEVPAEAGTSSESIEINFTIGGNTYSYTVR
jgi:uncharacterized membrane protein